MQTAWSARRVCSAPASAVEYTATASMPSSCSARITRTATSPRLATNTRENISGEPLQGREAVDGLELEQKLPEFHGRCILDVDRTDDPLDVRLHLVHQLHRLEDAERLPLRHRHPLLHERRRARSRGAV